MRKTITQESLLHYFIQTCHLLDDYEKIKRILSEEIEKDELRLEHLLKDYRENQNVESLVPMLIFTSRYYSQRKANNLAVICLIECQCILENLNNRNLLKGYIFAELGAIYEVKGVFKEASFYYKLAIAFAKEHKVPILMTYALERLICVISALGQLHNEDSLEILDVEYQNEYIDSYLKYQIALVKLYITCQYEEIISNREQLFKLSDDHSLMKKAILVHSLVQLNRTDEIEWDLSLLEEESTWQSKVYLLIYQITYHFVHDTDEELSIYLKKIFTQLQAKKQNGWLTFAFQFLLLFDRINRNECYVKEVKEGLNEVSKQIYYQEQRLRPRIQVVYQSYLQYYNGIQEIRKKHKYKLVGRDQFPISYCYEYHSKTVVGYFKLDECFYSDFKVSFLRQVIDVIDKSIEENMTFSVEDEGLWFYFKASCGDVMLKRKLNRLAEQWYEKLGHPYFISICLPRLTTDSFEETSEYVKSSFYGMVLNTNSKLPYEVNFCQGNYPWYQTLVKIYRLLEQASQRGEFDVEYIPLYYREGQHLFGIECHNRLDESMILNQLTREEHEEAALLLNIEKEVYLFKLGCKYLKEYNEKNSVNLSLFIKISRQTLLNKFLPSRILDQLKAYGINPTQVIISVNEDVLFEQNELIQKVIKRLREFGVNIALDEYGAGALTGSIRNLSIDYLRISSCFMQYLKTSTNCLSMMNSIINVCMSNDVKICCSQIENESNLHLIRDFGIDVVSGSYYPRKVVV